MTLQQDKNAYYRECMRVLTEDYLPHITEGLAPDEMTDLFYAVNLLRRAARDAVEKMIDVEHDQTGRWDKGRAGDLEAQRPSSR